MIGLTRAFLQIIKAVLRTVILSVRVAIPDSSDAWREGGGGCSVGTSMGVTKNIHQDSYRVSSSSCSMRIRNIKKG